MTRPKRDYRSLDDIWEEHFARPALSADPVLPSPAVGQREDDEGLRTDGRPVPGERAPKRSERLFTMLAPVDVRRLAAWARDRGLSKSTANALILRQRMEADGYREEDYE